MTIEYALHRFSDNRESTLGILHRMTAIKPFFQGYTLEDEGRDIKVMKETRIPANRYEIIINRAETPLTKKYQTRFPEWFKYHLMVNGVPNFKGVYFHLGNNDDDTDACILLGDSVNNNTIGDGEIRSSTPCFQRFYSFLYDHLDHRETPKGPYVNQAFITIRDEQYLKIT